MTVAYSVIFALSLLLPAAYFLFVRKNQSEPWLLVLFLSVCVVNLGYLLLSLSKTVAFALLANKVAYFGQIFVPLCMFMIISGLCGYRYKKWVSFALIGVAMVMFAMVLTTGHLDWYYQSVELIEADGAAKLIKRYGFLHPCNLIYVLSYFVAMLAVIGVSWKRTKGESQKLAGLMLAVVIGNIGMWIVEKLVTWNFEFLSVSYLMSEFVFFFVYWMLQDYIHVKDVPIVAAPTEKAKADALAREKGLTGKEREVLDRLLMGQSRKQIAADLHVSENTVKTHVKHIYEKLGVSGREEIQALLCRE